MAAAGVLTAGVFLIGQDLFSQDMENPGATEVGLIPLVVATEVLPTLTRVPDTLTPIPATEAYTPTVFVPPTQTPTFEVTPSPSPAAARPDVEVVVIEEGGCPHPADWSAYTVQPGDTLFAFQLGSDGAATVDDIMRANCLTERLVYEGQVIWLPPGAAENAPSSYVAPTPLPTDPVPPPDGLSRTPRCPCHVSIRQGWRLEQIAELIDSLPVGFSGADFLAAARIFDDRSYFVGAPPGASLEGYMLLGTYAVGNDTGALAFVNLVLDAFANATGEQLWADAAARGLNPYQTVTLASIINMESGSSSQQAMISSVFHNRLAAGMGLAATVTTQYALGRPGNWWPDVGGQVSTYDSPYNTNLYLGLPPAPIASPSPEALRAAVYPADTAYLYFTANCDGSGNAYAVTYDEHLANVRCE